MDLETLVLEAKRGNEAALEEIINRFKGFIVKTIRGIYISGYEPEDLLQIGYMTLIKAVQKYESYNNSSFVSYATSAIKNNFYYEIRQKSKIHSESSLNLETEDGLIIMDNLCSEENIEETIMLEEDKRKLMAALSLLTEDESDFIQFVYFHGGKIKEYSDLHNIKYVTLIKKKERILKKLRQLLS